MSCKNTKKSLPVYTYEGGEIIEHKCEAYGWPNLTDDGQVMYNNKFSSDRNEVVRWAKENAEGRGITSPREGR